MASLMINSRIKISFWVNSKTSSDNFSTCSMLVLDTSANGAGLNSCKRVHRERIVAKGSGESRKKGRLFAGGCVV